MNNQVRETDIWFFTKQDTNFDNAVKAVKLFESIKNKQNTNIEEYFGKHYAEFGLSTNRHRILISAQLFGLLTKQKIFGKSEYRFEKPTEVYELIKNYTIGSKEYNILKSEQLLKIRIKPIIDNTSIGYDKVILPIFYCFKVLSELNKKGCTQISQQIFSTYIMTAKRFSEWKQATKIILTNPPIDENLCKRFKDRSRIQSLISNNCKLFNFEADMVSLNKNYINYFSNFLESIDMNELQLLLDDIPAYTYFLQHNNNFNINIIDLPSQHERTKHSINQTVKSLFDNEEENFDSNYVEAVDKCKEENLNEHLGDNAYKKQPIISNLSGRKYYSKNPYLGKIAIKNANYTCMSNGNHKTFESKKTHHPYMEAHHLIPIKFTQKIWNKYNANIDCLENIVSLCPNCHRAVHYGSDKVRKEILIKLFDITKDKFAKIKINITLSDLLNMYGLK